LEEGVGLASLERSESEVEKLLKEVLWRVVRDRLSSCPESVQNDLVEDIYNTVFSRIDIMRGLLKGR